MDSMAVRFQEHINVLQARVRKVLEKNALDVLLIHSGDQEAIFLDDQTYPFKVNPHFKAWLPVTSAPNCWLLTDGVNKPKVWFFSPVDYWYSVEPMPEGFWTGSVDLTRFTDTNNISRLIPLENKKVGYIGNAPERAKGMGIRPENLNAKGILNYLDFHRSIKTDYELVCLREAQKIAIGGHHAAKQAFLAGKSEFDIHLAYLMATSHRDADLPYSNIVALNEHASVLHHCKLDHKKPLKILSALIDAGAEFNGYAADLTRTYSAQSGDDFSRLIKVINDEQLALINTLKVGELYTAYNLQMHQRIAKILKECDFVRGLSQDFMVEGGVTAAFLPHGLGHFLGLQVHDVAGFMHDEQGTRIGPPSAYPFLRCTRVLEPRMVLTVEPGIYFIESLLTVWRTGAYSKHFDWQRIDELKNYGGIRIEDNVILHETHVENMTRDLNMA